ncbi:MAG TPA: hypothetical protein VFL49_06435 [Pseudolabrys sp.]|nr:hypothetical protein [Pseudolabrys sp.]
MVETVATSHIVGVLLSEQVQQRTIRIGRFSANDRGAKGSKYPK